MNHEDREKLKLIIELLKDKLVIVEGKRDEKVLRKFGLDNVFAINGEPLYEVANNIVNTSVRIVILTDFDRRGRLINERLNYLLNKRRKRPDKKLRCMVMCLHRENIEDLKNISFGEVDDYVKVGTDVNKIYNKSADKRKGRYRKT
jgi:5S rRNA maturation endonuclease (ribonuclease M5)